MILQNHIIISGAVAYKETFTYDVIPFVVINPVTIFTAAEDDAKTTASKKDDIILLDSGDENKVGVATPAAAAKTKERGEHLLI